MKFPIDMREKYVNNPMVDRLKKVTPSRSESFNLATSREIVVRHKVGLHARPAAQFVKTAALFKSSVTVSNLSKGMPPANAKSILSVLSAAVQMSDRIRLMAEGADEENAIAALCELIDGNFGEPESST